MSVNSLNDIWQAVLGVLGQNLTDTAISTWFEDCEPVEIDGSTLVLKTSSDFKRDIIVKRFAETIKNAMSDIFSTEFTIKVLTEDELGDYEERKADNDPLPEMAGYTFDRFIVGNSNKFAHNAAVAVAHKPGSAYNPLFIYGNSGLGKTHLLLAIGQYIRENNPRAKIAYIKGDEFTNQLLKSIKEGTGEEFRMKYRNVDLFLVDDIQFIAGKQATQEEFFHTFNNIYEAGHQIVITSDRPPIEMSLLDDRLMSRFQGGLMADIQPPDYETRMAILKKNAESYNKEISEEIFDYIASNIKSNIRELEGAFNKVIAYSKLNKVDITLDIVIETLKDLISPNKVKQVTPELIINTVAEHYGVKPEDIKSPKRNSEFVLPRQVYMYVASKLTVESQQNIGKYINKKDHTTIIHGINKISTKLETDEELRNNVEIIMKKLNPH